MKCIHSNILSTLTFIMPPAIEIKGVGFSIGDKKILHDINLAIPSGKICALLGPSGCGKTSLIRLLLGLTKFNSGSIKVLNRHPSQHGAFVGQLSYVPQGLGLHPNLNVWEHLTLYARLSGLPASDIKDRLKAFVDAFDEDQLKRRVGSLSFGQQKLISAASALVIEADLSILDEPTVGLEPSRRILIWDRLFKLSQSNRSVLITTHHLNEARGAEIMVVMSEGRVVLQCSADSLIQKMNSRTLEDAYIKVYSTSPMELQMLSESAAADIADEDVHCSVLPTPQRRVQTFNLTFLRIRHATRIFAGEIWALKIIILSTFLYFLFSQVLLRHVLGPNPFDLPLTVINADEGTTDGQNYGNIFVDMLIQDQTSSLLWEVAAPGPLDVHIQKVREQVSFGVLSIPTNFSIAAMAAAKSRSAPIPLVLKMDMADKIIRETIVHQVYEAFTSFLTFHLDADSAVMDPTTFVQVVRGTSSMTNFLAVGTFISFAMGTTIVYAPNTIIQFRENEAMDRLLGIGVTPMIVIVSALIPWLCCEFLNFFPKLALNVWVMETPFTGDISLLLMLYLLTVASCAVTSLVIALSASTMSEGMRLVLVASTTISVLCGGMWPLECLPLVIRYLVQLLPITWLLRAFRLVMLQDATIAHPLVYQALLFSSLQFAAFFWFACVQLRSRTPVLARLKIQVLSMLKSLRGN
jgi:ABC-2 type transport system ATP-binding protein